MANERILGAIGAKLRTARDAMSPGATPRDSYLALAEPVRRYGGGEDALAPDGLLSGHELRVFSQNSEDGGIAELIRRHGVPSREFGAGDGHENNCAVVADVLGWDGLFIETDLGRHAALAAKYRGTARVRVVKARVSPATLERRLRDAAVQLEPDVLSIDVDGQDLWLWRSLERIRPRILVIEHGSSLPGDQHLIQPAYITCRTPRRRCTPARGCCDRALRCSSTSASRSTTGQRGTERCGVSVTGGRRGLSRRSHRVKVSVSASVAVLVYWPTHDSPAPSPSGCAAHTASRWPFISADRFYTMRTNAYDRFATRLEQRFSKAEIVTMMRRAGLRDIRSSEGEPYWCAVGVRE